MKEVKTKQGHKNSALISGKKLKTLKDRVTELEERVRRLEETSHNL